MAERGGSRVIPVVAIAISIAALSGCDSEAPRARSSSKTSASPQSQRPAAPSRVIPQRPIGSWATQGLGSVYIPIEGGFLYESMEDAQGKAFAEENPSVEKLKLFTPTLRVVDGEGDRLLQKGAVSPAISKAGKIAYLKLNPGVKFPESSMSTPPEGASGTVMLQDSVAGKARKSGITGAVRPLGWAGDTLVVSRHDTTTGDIAATELYLEGSKIASLKGKFELIGDDASSVFVSNGAGSPTPLLSRIDARSGKVEAGLSIDDYVAAVGAAPIPPGVLLSESGVKSLPSGVIRMIGPNIAISVGTGVLFVNHNLMKPTKYLPFPINGGAPIPENMCFEPGPTRVDGETFVVRGTTQNIPPYPEFTAKDTLQSTQEKYNAYTTQAAAAARQVEYRCELSAQSCTEKIVSATNTTVATPEAWNPSR